MFTSLCQFGLGVAVAFTGNYYFFVVLRFLLAMVSSACVQTCDVHSSAVYGRAFLCGHFPSNSLWPMVSCNTRWRLCLHGNVESTALQATASCIDLTKIRVTANDDFFFCSDILFSSFFLPSFVIFTKQLKKKLNYLCRFEKEIINKMSQFTKMQENEEQL